MGDLPCRVDAGIGAAGAADRHVLAAKPWIACSIAACTEC